MNQSKYFILLVSCMIFSACAAAGDRRVGSELKNQALHSANQTLNYSVQWVDAATIRVLDQMDIMIIDSTSSKAGNSIKAATVDLDITIELTPLAQNSTQMKINIQYPGNQMNRSTANEIFYQTRQLLLSDKQLQEKRT